MLPVVSVTIHNSQFPSQVNRALLDSLRSRQINHKFHYQSHKQTLKWLALHERYSPARNDEACAAIYDQSFAATASRVEGPGIHVIGLGCGGGQKDVRLMTLLKDLNKKLFYSPVDVGVGMVVVATEAAGSVIPATRCFPFVCDLVEADDLRKWIDPTVSAGARLVTFFGMMPNFEPRLILPRLNSLLNPNDYLLVSANLAPGPDYQAGVERVLPLYDNELTRDWLLTFLWDLGVEHGSGELEFSINEVEGLKRIEANFRFKTCQTIQVEGEQFQFAVGERLRLFFSYRHTPQLLTARLCENSIKVLQEWIAPSGDEGVFLCQKM